MRANLIFRIFIIFLLSTQCIAQTTFESNPSINNYTTCPGNTPSTCPSGTFLGGVIKFRLVNITSSDFVFEGVKCDGGSFSSSGTAYIKDGTVCGTIEDEVPFNSGASSITFNVPIPVDFTSGEKYYFFTLNSSTGDKFWGGFITITATSPPEYMEFTECFNASTSIVSGEDYSGNFAVDAVNDEWKGSIKLTLVDKSNTSNFQLLTSEIVWASVGAPDHDISWNEEINLSSGEYRLLAIADKLASSDDDAVEANGCSPTYVASGTGTVTHILNVTIEPPCSDGNPLSITNPDPNESFNGGLLGIQWDGAEQGSNCLVDIYYTEGINGTHNEISTGGNDDGIHLWSLNNEEINSNNIYVHVEYQKLDDNGNIVKDITGPITIGTSITAPSLELPADDVVFNSFLNEVTFSWDKNNAEGTADYEVKFRDVTTDELLLDYFGVGDVDSYTYTNASKLVNGHQYRWTVRANNGSGEIAEASPAFEFEIGDFGLEFTSPLRFKDSDDNYVNTLNQGETYTFETVVQNLGDGNWDGSLYLKINDYSPPESLGSFYIDSDSSEPIAYSYTPILAHTGEDVSVEFRYQTAGTGDSYLMGSFLFDNPVFKDIVANSLTITSPGSGESFEAGNPVGNITWNSTGAIPFVTLELVTSFGDPVEDIAVNIANTGQYNSYSIPSDIPPGDYLIKLYSYPTGIPVVYSEPLEVTNPSSFDLNLYAKTTSSVSPPLANENTLLSGFVKNEGNLAFSGAIKLQLENPDGSTIDLIQEDNIDIGTTNATNKHTISTNYNFPDGIGTYFLKVMYNPDPVLSNEPWFLVGSNGNINSNPEDFNVLDPDGNCDISNPSPTSGEAYEAVQYLCGYGVIQQPEDGDVKPDVPIIKQDLAKVVFLALYDFEEDEPTAADDFPVPFGDMQQQENQVYARYGKVLSYLQYDDDLTPFSRSFFNYKPASQLTRGEIAKVFIEAFDLPKDIVPNPFSDVSISHPYYKHITNLADLGIVSGSQNTFRPDDIATRLEVFIMLYRYLTACPDCEDPNPLDIDFYNPGNYTPANLGNHPGLSDANFDQYSKTSFYIPGRNLPLMFEHTYNSYLTELQDELFCTYNSSGDWISYRPLGEGWTHSYHSYIQKIDGYDFQDIGLYQPDQYVVIWPSGGMHVYEGEPSNLDLVTKGVYDDISYDAVSESFVIKKKNQIEYTYKKVNSVIESWPFVMTKIEDRNGNKIELEYENYSGGGLRLKRVKGTAGRILTFNYSDPNEKIYSVTDPIGRTVTFSYGGTGGADLHTYTDAENYTTTYQYFSEDGNDHLLRYINLPNGNFVDNQYNDRKLTSSTTKNSGGSPISSQSIVWNLGSTPQAKTSSMVTIEDGSNTYEYEYENNELGKVTSLSTPSNQLDNTMYGDPSNPTLPTSVTIDEITTTYSYDAQGNVVEINQPLGVEHSFVYNSLNDITSYTNPRNNTTTFTYEGPGNLKNINSPIGTTTFNYNSHGLVTKTINPEGLFTNIVYDNYGNPKEISTSEGIKSKATYDLAGRVKTQVNPNSQTTSYEYDNRDFLKKVTDPMSFVTQYNYDGNGNLKEITNAKGNKTTMSYNYFDWLESITFGGLTKEFDYDDEGKLIRVTKPNGTQLDYVYDIDGNLVNNNYASFTYDAKNRLETVGKDGKTLTYFYDDLHRIIKTTYDDKSVEYDYDLNSNVTKIKYPGGLEVNYTYDAKDRLETVEDWNGATTMYQYLDDDRISDINYPNGVTTEYAYDQAGRVISLVTHLNNDTIAGYDFQLDLVGNHLEETKNEPLDSFYLPPQETTASYNSKNWIEDWDGNTYSHDDNGNMTSQTGRTYTWDNHDMLVAIGGDINALYKYDGLGNRRESIVNGVGKKYVLDVLGMSQVLVESTITGNPENYYVYGLGLISRIKPDGSTRYYHGDFRGSTVAMTNELGEVTHSYLYGPFGNVWNEDVEDENIFQFVGIHGVQKETDDLCFMRARYYNSEIGRFISEDPIWSDNLYGYSGNNPITNGDPNGKEYGNFCPWPDETKQTSMSEYSPSKVTYGEAVVSSTLYTAEVYAKNVKNTLLQYDERKLGKDILDGVVDFAQDGVTGALQAKNFVKKKIIDVIVESTVDLLPINRNDSDFIQMWIDLSTFDPFRSNEDYDKYKDIYENSSFHQFANDPQRMIKFFYGD